MRCCNSLEGMPVSLCRASPRLGKTGSFLPRSGRAGHDAEGAEHKDRNVGNRTPSPGRRPEWNANFFPNLPNPGDARACAPGIASPASGGRRSRPGTASRFRRGACVHGREGAVEGKCAGIRARGGAVETRVRRGRAGAGLSRAAARRVLLHAGPGADRRSDVGHEPQRGQFDRDSHLSAGAFTAQHQNERMRSSSPPAPASHTLEVDSREVSLRRRRLASATVKREHLHLHLRQQARTAASTC